MKYQTTTKPSAMNAEKHQVSDMITVNNQAIRCARSKPPGSRIIAS